MRLLKQLDNNITLTQSETTQFITYLTNPEINVEDKVDLLTQFTKKEIKQQELTYVVNSLIQTMYLINQHMKEVYVYAVQEGISQTVSIFLQQYRL